jgi:hypothetical protein
MKNPPPIGTVISTAELEALFDFALPDSPFVRFAIYNDADVLFNIEQPDAPALKEGRFECSKWVREDGVKEWRWERTA